MSQSCSRSPCPGNSFPLSLTPISRLMADIAASPQKPLTPINKPANNACNVFSGVSNGPIISDAIMVVITPPPDLPAFFPGLTLGTTFLLPQDFPINTVQYRLTLLTPKEITPVTPRPGYLWLATLMTRRHDSRRKRSLSSPKKWRSRYAENRRYHLLNRQVVNIRTPSQRYK